MDDKDQVGDDQKRLLVDDPHSNLGCVDSAHSVNKTAALSGHISKQYPDLYVLRVLLNSIGDDLISPNADALRKITFNFLFSFVQTTSIAHTIHSVQFFIQSHRQGISCFESLTIATRHPCTFYSQFAFSL